MPPRDEDFQRWLAGETAVSAPPPAPPIPGLTPDKAATAYQAAADAGRPLSFQDMDIALSQQAAEQRRRQEALRSSPKASAWISVPENSVVSNDDAESLAWWEKWQRSLEPQGYARIDPMARTGGDIVRGVIGVVGGGIDYLSDPENVKRDAASVPQAWRGGTADLNFNLLSYRVATKQATPEEEAEFERQRALRSWGGERFTPSGPLSLLAQQLPNFLHQTGEAAPEMLTAAGAAAMAGQAGPQIAAPEEVVTVPAAAAFGWRVGAVEPSWKMAYGEAYAEFRDLRDEKGTPLNPEAARIAAMIVAGPSAALDVFGFGQVMEAGGFSGGISKQAMRQLLTRPDVASRLGVIGAKWARGSGAEGLTEALQESLLILGGEASMQQAEAEDPGRSFARPSAGERTERVIQAGAAGALLGGVVDAPAAVVGATVELHEVAASRREQAFFEQIAANAEGSKLKGRLPKKYQEAVDAITRGGEADTVYAQAEPLVEYLQSNGTDLTTFAAEVGLDPNEIQRALQEGGKVAIPMGSWAGIIAGTELDKAMRPYITLRQGGMTATEAADYEANAEELAEVIGTARTEAEAAEADRLAAEAPLREAISAELAKDPGFDDQVVGNYTDLAMAFYRRLAADTGWDMARVQAEYPPLAVASAFAGRPSATPAPARPRVAPESIAPIIEATAARSGIDVDYLNRLAAKESSFNPRAQAGTSTAAGLYQFVDRTWVQTIKSGGLEAMPNAAEVAASITFDRSGRAVITTDEQRALMALRFDPAASGEAVARLTTANRKALTTALGREPTGAELYIAHFAGAAGAKKLLTADRDANAAELMPGAARANPTIFYEGKGDARRARTVGEVITRLSKGFSGEPVLAGGGGPVAPAPTFDEDPALAITNILENGPSLILEQMAGRRARTADLASMTTAINLESKGRSPEDIWTQTGWMRGEDGKWRFEIDDSEARFTDEAGLLLEDDYSRRVEGDAARARGEAVEKSPPLRLGDIYQHDKLYAAYPGLRTVEVDTATWPGVMGAFDPAAGRISLSPGADRKQLLSTLTHEIQHAIQEVETFAKGAGADERALRSQGYGAALDERKERYIAAAVAEDDMRAARGLSRNLMGDMRAAIRDAIMETYRRASGEVEARQTQARMDLSPIERAMRFPNEDRDVPFGEGIVAGAAPNPWAKQSSVAELGGVESAAFKRWFGDSKVVDENGEPLVVYHGTNQPIDTFDQAHGAAATGEHGGAKLGLFFTSNPENAGDYAENAGKVLVADMVKHAAEVERLRAAVVEAERRANRTGDWDAYERAMEAWEDAETGAINADDITGQNIVPVYLRITNPKVIERHGAGIPLDLTEQIEAAKAEGHDGFIMRDVSDPPPHTADHFVVFKPTQIKSVFNGGAFDPADPRILYQSADSPIYFSALGRAVGNSNTTRASADQWLATINNAPGVKREEVEWSGVEEWLRLQDGPVSKADLMEFVTANGVVVEEVVLGDARRWQDLYRIEYEEPEASDDDPFPEPRWEVRSAYGLEYTAETYDEAEEWVADEAGAQETTAQFSDWKLPGADDTYREVLLYTPKIEGPSTHWSQKNVIAHTRLTERTDAEGKRVLFIEEVQSDWHQKGRDQGYARAATKEERDGVELRYVEAQLEWDRSQRAFNDALNEWGDRQGVHENDPAAEDRYETARLRLQEARIARDALGKGIPNAPFKTSWPALVMKRMIRWAVDKGYERVAWTTGEQQIDRYDLSATLGDHVLVIEGAEDGTYEVQPQDRRASDAIVQAGHGSFVVNANGYSTDAVRMTREKVLEVFGAGVGQQLIAAAGSRDGIGAHDTPSREAYGEVRTANMSVGGEGMRAFYDRNLVNITNDIIKRYGAKVERIGVDLGEREVDPVTFNNVTVHDAQPGFTITPKLAEAAKGGFSLFQRPGNVPSLRPAIRYGGKVYSSVGDHRSALSQIPDEKVRRRAAMDAENRGYVDERGRFMNRFRAQEYALANGLIRDDAPAWAFTSPELISENLRKDPLYQSPDADVARGSIRLPAEGLGQGRRAVLSLYAGRDLSTVLHEFGHWFLEVQRSLERRADAPEAVRQNMDALRAWWNIPPEAEIGVREHEMFAEAFEQYLYDGRAPSLSLTRPFEAFRGWLVFIYRRLRGIRSDVPQAVRDVFDRLLATEEEIALARAQQGMAEPFLTDPEAQGLSPAQAEAYAAVRERAAAQAQQEADARVLRAVRRQQTAWWKEREAEMLKEVDEEVASRRVYRAFEWLAHERWLYGDTPEELVAGKLSRKAIVDDYGEQWLRDLPRGFGRLYAAEGGQHPDDVAAMFGYGSGGELMADLASAPPRREVVAQETAGRMMEAYGELDDLPAVAMDSAHNASQQRVIELELEAISGRPAQKGMAEAARRDTLTRRVGDLLKPDKHLAAERRAANAAQKAFAKGDKTAALIAKMQQLASFVTWRATRDAADEIEKSISYMKKFDREGVRKRLDGGYIEQIDELLNEYDLRKASGAELSRRESLTQFVQRMDEEGMPHNIDPRLIERAGRRHYTTLTLDELRGLVDSIRSIEKLGRLKKTLLDNKKRRDREAIIEEMLDQISALKDRPTKDDLNPKRNYLREADAGLWRMETLFDWLDKGHGVNGVFNRVLMRPATDAQNREGQLQETVGRALKERYQAVPKEISKRWKAKVVVPELVNPDTGSPFNMTRGELLAVALNVGNDSNLMKLAEGYGWNEDLVMAVLNRELLAEEWQFVQGVWDTLETLWPDIAKAERALTGTEPERVEVRPIMTPHGELRGGYYPVVYDPRRSMLAQRNADKEAADMFNGIFFTANTPRGHTMKRTNFTGPMFLSVEGVLFNHINKVIKRISHGEYAISARSFIQDPRVAAAISQKVGPEYYAQLMPWLQRQVNDRIAPLNGLAWWERFADTARINFQMVAMGFRVSTGLAQAAGLSNSIAEIGAEWVSRGLYELGRAPFQAAAFVDATSEEMRQRSLNIDRDLRDLYRELEGGDGVVNRIRRMAFQHIGFMDATVSKATWLGAFHRALAEGETTEDAAAAGDKAVRRSQGAGGAKDLSAIQDIRGFGKWLTLFYSYFSVQYQRQRDIARAVTTGDFGTAFNYSFWVFMLAPLAASLLTGDLPEEKDDLAAWLEWAGSKVFFNAFQGVPVVRDAASYAQKKVEGKFAEYQVSPLGRVVGGTEDLIRDLYGALPGTDEDPSDRWVKHAIETPGYFVGLPTGQLAQSVQYLWDFFEGDQRPENVGEFLKGLQSGPQKDQQ